MILRAFSKSLQSFMAKGQIDRQKINAVDYLDFWLFKMLTTEVKDNVSKVIHTEIAIEWVEPSTFRFISRSESGDKLLITLYNFAQSYDNFLFSKWIHQVKATDFGFKQDQTI